MAFELNSDLARIRYSYSDLYIKYTGAEVKQTSDKKFSLVPDFKIDPTKKNQNLQSSKKLSSASRSSTKVQPFLGAGGFFEKTNNEARNAIIDGQVFLFTFENFDSFKVLEDDAEFVVIPALSLCVGSFSVTGTKQTNDVFTTCGYMQFVNPTVQHSANINLALPLIEEDSFFSESFNQLFQKLKYGDDFKPENFKKVENKDFDFFFNFQQIKEKTHDNIFVTFKAKITTNQVSKDSAGAVSQSDIPLAVSSTVTVHPIRRNIELFGDDSVEVPTPAPTPEPNRRNGGANA